MMLIMYILVPKKGTVKQGVLWWKPALWLTSFCISVMSAPPPLVASSLYGDGKDL